MKRIYLFITIFITVITFSNAQDLSFGIKAGANFASLSGSDSEVDGRTSFHAGAVANISIGDIFAIQPELLFSSQGYTNDFDGDDLTAKFDYLNIPVLADVTITEGLSLQAGPQLGINLSDNIEINGIDRSIGAESIDFSAALGAQYHLPLGLFFQARYTIGFTNVFPEISVDGMGTQIDAKNSVFSLSAGWFFN